MFFLDTEEALDIAPAPLPSDRILEPNLLVPGKKPVGPVEVNNIPGLAFLALPDGRTETFEDLVARRPLTTGGVDQNEVRGTPKGRALKAISTSGGYTVPAIPNTGDHNYTIVFQMEFPLQGSSWRTVCRGAGIAYHLIFDSNGFLGVHRGTFYSSGIDGDTLDGVHTIVAVADRGASTTDFYLDGRFVGTANKTAEIATENIGYIMKHTSTSQVCLNPWLLFAVFNEKIDASFAASISSNPYQLVKPKGSIPQAAPIQSRNVPGGFALPQKFEMPELLIPGRKPVGPVDIDWSHPLARGLYDFWILHQQVEPVDVTGRAAFGSLVNAPLFGADSGGLHHDINGASSQIVRQSTTGVCNGKSDHAFLVVAQIASVNTGNYVVAGEYSSTSANKLFCLRREAVYLGYGIRYSEFGGALQYARLSSNPNDDKLHVFAFGVTSGVQWICMDGGDYQTNNLTAYSAANTNDVLTDRFSFGVGDRSSPFEYSTVNIYSAGRYSRGLTEPEALALTRDPYQFLIPA